MKRIWIIGAGKFGRRAASLLRHGENNDLIIVDKQKEKLQGLEGIAIAQDGVKCLAEKLPSDSSDWIIPAVPFHLVYEWARTKMASNFLLVPTQIDSEWQNKLPNCILGGEGQCFVSNANFLCPDNCPEPKNTCIHTGLSRPRIMYRFLAEWGKRRFDTTVIRSRQLAPGVGGYPAKDMFLLLDHLHASQSYARQFFLATACSCHGVVNLFKIIPR